MTKRESITTNKETFICTICYQSDYIFCTIFLVKYMISQNHSFEETLDAIKVTIVLKLPQNQKFEMKLNFQVIQNHA